MSSEQINLRYKRIDIENNSKIGDFFKKHPQVAQDICDVIIDSRLAKKDKLNVNVLSEELKIITGVKGCKLFLAYDQKTRELLGVSIGGFRDTVKAKNIFFVEAFAVRKKFQKRNIGTRLFINMYGNLRKFGIKEVRMHALDGTHHINQKIAGKIPIKETKKRRILPHNEYSLRGGIHPKDNIVSIKKSNVRHKLPR